MLRFCEASPDCVTDAEREQSRFGKPGAVVFTFPSELNPNWCLFLEDAQWRYPEAPYSFIKVRDSNLVVQV